jgi:4-hydroxybenzoate polyprenyltransferase
MRAAAAKACLDLSRISNLPTVWSNVLVATVLAVGTFRPGAFLLLAAALSSFYMGGMALNDLCDREYDRQHRPARPLPSGQISIAGARRFTTALFAGGFLLLAFVPYQRALFAALFLAAVIVIYDLRHKENPASILLMATCRFLVFIVTALAIAGRIPPPVLLAGGVQFAYILVISLIARHENELPHRFFWPAVPLLLAGISLLDGIVLAALVHPEWLAAGVAGFLLTMGGQRYVRGD